MPDPMRNADDKRRYANALRLASERRIEEFTQQLADGKISLQDWQLKMREELRTAALQQYVTGKGGVVGQDTDYLALGPELRSQYKYLSKFAQAIDKANQQGKPLTFAVQRAKLYARSTQAIFWKSTLPVKLPQVPRDGKTQCRGNCNCYLDMQDELDDDGNRVAVLVYWRLRPAEHCDDCRAMARKWNPLRLEISETNEADITQGIALMLWESPEFLPVVRELHAIFDTAVEWNWKEDLLWLNI